MKNNFVTRYVNDMQLLRPIILIAFVSVICPLPIMGQDEIRSSPVSFCYPKIEIDGQAIESRKVAHVESELTRMSFASPMNLIIIEARLNGTEMVNLLLDSGSNTSLVLDNSVAKKMDLKMSSPVKGGRTSQGGKFTMQFVKRLSLDTGDQTTELKRILVAPCLGHAQTMLGIDVHGIIGQPFIQKYVVALDYEKNELVLHDPKKYEYQGDGEILDIEFDPQVGNLPFVKTSFESKNGRQHEIKMLIDSGGSTNTTGGLGLQEDIQAIVPNDAPRIQTKGVTGLADDSKETIHSSFLTQVHRMKLGTYVLDRPVLSCGSTHNFNLFGSEVLHRFDVVFDYSRKRLILNPNQSFADPLQIDKSGIMLIAKKNNVNTRLVQFVTPESPAAEAGLKGGDVVVEINDKPADALGLIETRELFFQAGRSFELKVKRGTELLSLKMKTRDLF